MLTPVFELSQTEEFIVLKIRAPYAKVSESEVLIEGKEILFSSKPYYLRLYLSGEITENGNECAKYDPETGYFTVYAPKAVPGQHFSDLDMITKLLTPQGSESAKLPVEVVDGTLTEPAEEEDWSWQQKVPRDQDSLPRDMGKAGTHGYGFGNRRVEVFAQLKDEISELYEGRSPDEISLAERKLKAFAAEEEKFDEDHYLADYFDEDLLTHFVSEEISEIFEREILNGKLSEEETRRLKDFPKRKYELSPVELNAVTASLIDIIFVFAYDFRVTGGEHNVESGWTISKLSSTLSNFVKFDSLGESVTASFRRSLCYPLCRNWKMSQQIFDDTISVVKKGKVVVLKCLLAIHDILGTSGEFRYILNDLYITDYCIWIQTVSDDTMAKVGADLQKLKLEKNVVKLDLEELELAAQMTQLNFEKQTTLAYETENADDVIQVVKKNLDLEGKLFGKSSLVPDSDDDE